MRALVVVLLAACAVESDPSPDATPVAQDACTREPTGDCCALLPDEDAARQCAMDAAGDANICGQLACWSADCQLTRVAFCNRP